MKICTLVEHDIRNILSFGSGGKSAYINSEKSTTKLNGPHISEFEKL
jgi:hypothetical protein